MALLLALFFFRPGRRRRALRSLSTPGSKRVLVIRLDARVGEALLTTPLLDALTSAGHHVELITHPKLVSFLEGHPSVRRVWSARPRLPLIHALRAQPFDVVINAGNWSEPAVTSAIIARAVAPRAVVLGPAVAPTHLLMDVAVAPRSDQVSEAAQRAHLATPLVGPAVVGPLTYRRLTPSPLRPQAPYAVINPGGRLGYRRVPTSLFGLAARELLSHGVLPLVTWGPNEEALVEEVLRAAPGAHRAPPTDLLALGALMQEAVLTVCNNTGPMHLSVAVGCPTVALFLHMDVARWGHAGPPHQMVDLTGVAQPELQVSQALTRVLQARNAALAKQPAS